MIIDEKIKKILQSNDFQKISQSLFTENSNNTNSQMLSNGSKPRRRKVVKLKNSLLQAHVSPDVKRMYYSTQKLEQPNTDKQQTETFHEPKAVSLPPLIKKETPNPSETNTRINTVDLIAAISEIFPQEHQLWNDLQVSGQPIEQVILQNQDFFSDLLNLYLQEMEIRFLKDRKQHCKSKYNTQYHDDFKDKLMLENTSINRWIYERAKQQASFLQNSSTYNQHFVQQKYEKVDNFKPDHIPNLNQISCLSSYNANFCDWKKLYHGIIGPFHVQSEKRLPFIAESNYTRNYITQKYEKIDPIIPKPLGPFPVETQSLVKETTHKCQFSSPQLLDQSGQKIISPRSQVAGYNGYQPHFNKQNTQPQSNSFAERFFHSPVVKELMKKNQQQKIN